MEMDFRVDVDDIVNQLARQNKVFTKNFQELIRKQIGLSIKSVMRTLPPHGGKGALGSKNFAGQKNWGQWAIAGDILKIYETSFDLHKLIKTKIGEEAAKQFAYIMLNKSLSEAITFVHSLGLSNMNVAIAPDFGLHKSQRKNRWNTLRKSYGHTLSKQYILSKSTVQAPAGLKQGSTPKVNAYIKKTFKDIGRTKAGFANTPAKWQVKGIPAWVTKSLKDGESTYINKTKKTNNPQAAAINKVPWINRYNYLISVGLKNQNSRLQKATDYIVNKNFNKKF